MSDRLLEKTRCKFHDRYGRWPRYLAVAPGRVNLIGEHTDYNGGFVLPMAIEAYAVVAADRRGEVPGEGADAVVRLHSEAVGESIEWTVSEQTPPRPDHWSNYVLGVLVGCCRRGLATGPADLLIESTVPLGGGLSSSAALEVATATLVETITGETMPPAEKALLCQRAEHEFAGTPCGIMDQFSSVMAQADHLMLLDCRSHMADLVPFSDPDLTILIINSNVHHALADGEYARRREQCRDAARQLGVAALRDLTPGTLADHKERLDPLLFRRARHVVEENARTVRAAAAVAAGDWPTVGQLMAASHRSLRDDFEVSCRELDLLVELAEQLGPDRGVYGSRMTGGGFGGSTVHLVRREALPEIVGTVLPAYFEQTGRQAASLTTRPAGGAFGLQVEPGK